MTHALLSLQCPATTAVALSAIRELDLWDASVGKLFRNIVPKAFDGDVQTADSSLEDVAVRALEIAQTVFILTGKRYW